MGALKLCLAQVMVLRVKIGPAIVPRGIVSRLQKACPHLSSEVVTRKCSLPSEVVTRKCSLPLDVNLVKVLAELAEYHKQTGAFWKRSAWLPKEKQSSAYYRMEDEDLWAIRYIKDECMEGEWVLEKLGRFFSTSWEKLSPYLE